MQMDYSQVDVYEIDRIDVTRTAIGEHLHISVTTGPKKKTLWSQPDLYLTLHFIGNETAHQQNSLSAILYNVSIVFAV